MTIWDQVLSALQAAVPAAAPLLYGTLGEVTAERSGVVNLGMEGMMLMGAVVAFAVTQATGNVWLALLAAALIGALMGLIHAFTTISLRINQVVGGLALTMIGTGISGIMGKRFIGMPPRAQLKPV
ncbi:MAG: ABC transporter permease, partial [Thermoflexia bacterium]